MGGSQPTLGVPSLLFSLQFSPPLPFSPPFPFPSLPFPSLPPFPPPLEVGPLKPKQPDFHFKISGILVAIKLTDKSGYPDNGYPDLKTQTLGTAPA